MSASAGSTASATAQSPAFAAPTPPPQWLAQRLAQISSAAREAQGQCHGRIHHDTYAFEECLLAMAVKEKRPSPRRLGIEYFGYVGAMNSERMGMEGATATAYEFLRRLRKTQQRLAVGDLALCQTIPGDCQIRTAQMAQMLTNPEYRQPRVRDRAAEHQHVH